MVLNGKGLYDCDPKNDTRCTGKKDFFEVTLERGTKYKIGLTHTGTLLTETFWIDGHNFTVISNDFVAIEPYVTDVINIGIGMVSPSPPGFANSPESMYVPLMPP